MTGPDPNMKYPIKGNQNVQFIKNMITRPNIVAGDYSYYDVKSGESFEDQVLYHYEILGDRLIIGKFCSIAAGAVFIMNGANHRMDGSTYPFHLFGGGWEKFIPSLAKLPLKGDTIVGNDVWIGREATIMPGVRIGDGAVIAAKSVVTKDVEPYTIVGGNPAKFIRARFPKEMIAAWLNVKWWDWDMDTISNHIEDIVNGDIGALKKVNRVID